MADDRFTEREEFDQPEQRLDEFFKWMAMAPSGYFAALDGAMRHQAAATADAGARHWISIGPRNVGGAIRALAQHPSKPNTFFAGSAQGGLWTSIDNGYSWQPVTGVPPGVPVGAIAFAPNNPDTIYVGTGEPIIYLDSGGNAVHQVAGNGLFRSLRGAAFTRMVGAASAAVNGAADNYTRIIVDPNEPERAWAASERGLWRCDPGGAFTLEPLPLGAARPLVTDVALTSDPAHADTYVLLAGVYGVGVFRAVFTRSTHTMSAWTAIVGPWAGGIGRVRVAFSGTKAGVNKGNPFAYAVMEDNGTMHRSVVGYPTVVYQSADLGLTWPARDGARAFEPPAAGAKKGTAWYTLVLAVDPDDPLRLIGGCVDLHQSGDGGLNFAPPSVDRAPILDWRLYDAGDRAQHGDIHAVVFDSRESCRLWVCNDGGISYTDDFLAAYPPPTLPRVFDPPATPKPRWRKRSYGIVAAQFTGFTSHPTYPYICGGGMQDNGTFVSYGGPTWYRLFGADGGETGFDATDPRHFFPSWQSAIEEVRVQAAGTPPYPENSSVLPDVDPPGNVMAPVVSQVLQFPDVNKALWIGVIAFDPVVANRMVIGRAKDTSSVGGFYTSDGVTMTALNTPAINGAVTAAAFAPNSPDIWIGTEGTATADAQVYSTSAAAPAAPGAWTLAGLPPPGGGFFIPRIAGIAVHPQNSNVIAVSTMGWGAVFLSHDHGAHWLMIRGGATQNMPPGPVPCVAWDPTNTQVLFAGTLAGVYVTRDLPARAAGTADLTAAPAFTPHWAPYSLDLPVVQVNEFSATANGTLRAATYGRGVYESDLPGTAAGFQIPRVRLSIREHVADDSRTYAAANSLADDPRLPAGAHPIDRTRAIDIRIDAPGFVRSEAFAFGEDIDGVEFDETFVCDKPIVGVTNRIYVQVHNRGWDAAASVRVNLYYADAGNPAAVPAIDANFGFPGLPGGGSPWRLAESRELPAPVRSGHPVVERFDWIPPPDIKDNVVLLAICTNPLDQVTTPIPAGAADAFVAGERRAAMRLTSVLRDPINIRDGNDDDGNIGAVAWGGRSPDIIVTQNAVANHDDPAGPFADLADRREDDVVKIGTNHIYVRISNRMQMAVKAKVRVYAFPFGAPAPGTGWTQLGEVQVDNIPASGWKFAAIDWNGVADPGPDASAYKAFTLVAVASLLDVAGATLDPFPDPATVTDIDSFWGFLTGNAGARSAAMRGLRFQ